MPAVTLVAKFNPVNKQEYKEKPFNGFVSLGRKSGGSAYIEVNIERVVQDDPFVVLVQQAEARSTNFTDFQLNEGVATFLDRAYAENHKVLSTFHRAFLEMFEAPESEGHRCRGGNGFECEISFTLIYQSDLLILQSVSLENCCQLGCNSSKYWWEGEKAQSSQEEIVNWLKTQPRLKT